MLFFPACAEANEVMADMLLLRSDVNICVIILCSSSSSTHRMLKWRFGMFIILGQRICMDPTAGLLGSYGVYGGVSDFLSPLQV